MKRFFSMYLPTRWVQQQQQRSCLQDALVQQ